MIKKIKYQIKKRGKSVVEKRKQIKKYLVRTLLVIAGVLIFAAAIATFSFARHRQLCGFQALVEQGKLQSHTDANLCPNLLSSSDWGQIVANAFNVGVLNQLTPRKVEAGQFGQDGEACTDQLNPLCWVTGTKPNLKQTNGFTNLLLVGLDTRESGAGSFLKNTDTIMLVSLDHRSGKLLFISFPRDLYLSYYRPNGLYVSYKINGVYAIDGVEGLKGVIEQVSGEPVHYYAFVDLQLVTDVIDRLDGIDITLDEDFEEWYPCDELPKGVDCPSRTFITDGYFGLFKYPAGDYTFDSLDALVYSRGRKITLDFGRAERQQHLIRSIINDVLADESSLSDKVALYLDLYSIFKDQVITNVQLEDVAALFTFADKLEEAQAAQLVADYNLGGPAAIIKYIGILPGVGWSIGFNDSTYQQFQTYIDQIWNNLTYFLEKPKVLFVNATGTAFDKSQLNKVVKDNPYVKYKIDPSDEVLKGVRIYDLSNGTKSGSVSDIQASIPGSLIFNAEIDGVTKSSYGEDILVIFGNRE